MCDSYLTLWDYNAVIKFPNHEESIILTCAKLKTGWSFDNEVEEADGEAVREDADVNLEESSSRGDSLPADSEAETENGWLDNADWWAALLGDVQRLACRPEIKKNIECLKMIPHCIHNHCYSNVVLVNVNIIPSLMWRWFSLGSENGSEI